jgi:hypothetical protein
MQLITGADPGFQVRGAHLEKLYHMAKHLTDHAKQRKYYYKTSLFDLFPGGLGSLG